ncbi:MAG: outer membrane lipid asymmetry maintenance protein MlaD [Rhodospirillaceae bacterium]
MGRNSAEAVLGAVVLIAAAGFLFIAINVAQVKTAKGYNVSAAFLKIGGLSAGSDVRINGIKIGTVTDRRLDPQTFDAVVTMSIQTDVKLPKDTVATIGSEGILGGKYVRLKPGTDKEYLPVGGRIAKTEDFKSLEDQVGEIIFLATGGT